MSTAGNTAKIRSIGQHDAQMIDKLSAVVVNQWVELHRHGRSDAPAEVKNRLLEILGGGVFEWCWASLAIDRASLQKGDEESVARVRAHLCKVSVRPTLCNKVCYSVSMISARMRAISVLARKAPKSESRALWKGYNYLFNVLFELLNTGALAEMPNSSRHARLDDRALENLVAVLPERWETLQRRAGISGQVGCVSISLGKALGLPIFAGVRGQREGRITSGPEGLKLWYSMPQARRIRGFYAEVGASVHELAQIAKDLREERQGMPYDTPRRQAANLAITVVEDTMMSVINSGVLYCMP